MVLATQPIVLAAGFCDVQGMADLKSRRFPNHGTAADRALTILAHCLLIAHAACAPGPSPTTRREICSFGPIQDLRSDPIVVVLHEAVTTSHAPVPANEAERLVFGHLYETITRIDCQGRVVLALGASIESDSDDRVWTIAIRDAWFTDGNELEPRHIIESWRRAYERRGKESVPWCWIDPYEVYAKGPNQLHIQLRESTPDLPRILAHPSLAVASSELVHGYPRGSGAYRLADPADVTARAATARLARTPHPTGTAPAAQSETTVFQAPLILVPNERCPQAGRSTLVVEVAPEVDPRDLDPSAPVVARVGSRRALDFLRDAGADGSPRFVVDALPWNERYLLLVPDPTFGALHPPIDRFVDPAAVGTDPSTLQQRWASVVDKRELADHVVRSEARACSDLGWKDAGCGPVSLELGDPDASSGRTSETPSSLEHETREEAIGIASSIAYLASDPEAASIAERLVARAHAHAGSLAGAGAAGETASIRALALDPVRFRRTLERGDAHAYVYAIPQEAVTTCTAPARLFSLCPWLLDGFDDQWRHEHPLSDVVPLGADLESFLLARGRIVPLLQTRSSLVRRREIGGVSIDGNLVLRLESAGWRGDSPLP